MKKLVKGATIVSALVVAITVIKGIRTLLHNSKKNQLA